MNESDAEVCSEFCCGGRNCARSWNERMRGCRGDGERGGCCMYRGDCLEGGCKRAREYKQGDDGYKSGLDAVGVVRAVEREGN